MSLRVGPEEGGEWSVILVNEEETFVDVYNRTDPYPEQVWEAANIYFEQLSEEDGVLPGGRYVCAQVLRSRNLPFFRNLTLGRICHFVQLAISTRKLLGYLDGGITSYKRSHSYVKDSAALQNELCSQVTASGLRVASWEDARNCIKHILIDALNSGEDKVPLSNIKRICRSQFCIELSETSLGHSKLSDFLQDLRLSDICTVRLQEQGYFVMPHFAAASAFQVGKIEAESSLVGFGDTSGLMLELNDTQECDTPLWTDELLQDHHADSQHDPLAIEFFPLSHRANMVQNTFIHAPLAPVVDVNQRPHSVPPRSPLLTPFGHSRSPGLASVLASSPLELLPLTPEQWASGTPTLSPFLQAQSLDSVPESDPMTEKFTWDAPAQHIPSLLASVEVERHAPVSSMPFRIREMPLIAAGAQKALVLCLADCV